MPGSIPESAIARGEEMALATRQLPSVATVRDLTGHRVWAGLWKFIRTKPLGALGAMVVLVMIFVAVFTDLLAPYDVYDINQRLQFHAPSMAHWFGTDEFGRDVLS